MCLYDAQYYDIQHNGTERIKNVLQAKNIPINKKVVSVTKLFLSENIYIFRAQQILQICKSQNIILTFLKCCKMLLNFNEQATLLSRNQAT